MIQILGQNQPTSQVTSGYDSYRRLRYADVADERASDLVRLLREQSDIQSADLPAQRQVL
jgi:hypothetical protein